MFPSDFFTVEAETPTGLRLDLNEDNAPWLSDVPELIGYSLADVSVSSGFGTNGPILVRFTEPVGELPIPDDSSQSTAIQLIQLTADGAVARPYSATAHNDGLDLFIQPLRPLEANTRHALIVTREFVDGNGSCYRPSETMIGLLTGDVAQPGLEPLVPRVREVLDHTGLDLADVSAMTVFTTHGDLEPMLTAAATIRDTEYTFSEEPVCAEWRGNLRCETAFEPFDFRVDRIVEDGTPGDPWHVPVTVWLPNDGEGPFPTIVVGHGINNDRGMGNAVASHFVPLGYAVVAADALEHGDHPTNIPEDSTLDAMTFLGIDMTNIRIDALAMRGNFNQTALDRLQLIEVIRGRPDVDGDDEADLAVDELFYYGISLGGMMGSSLLALSEDFDAGLLAVAGGGLLTFITDNSQVAPLKPVIMDLAGGEANFQRLLTVIQPLIDAADPATYAAIATGDRVNDGFAPDVLLQVALEDEQVPPETGRTLARALWASHVRPVAGSVDLLEVEDAPLAGNRDDGDTTVAYFQLDRVTEGDSVAPARHNNTPFSAEGALQAVEFFESSLRDGLARVIDPYSELATPPLQE